MKSEPLEISPRGTRGRRLTEIFFRVLKPLAAGQIKRYRKRAAPEPPKMGGVPLVLLTTVGAKSGRERTSVLGGFEEPDGSWLIVGSKGGAATHPAWFINLAKHPDNVWLEVGKRKLHVRPELLKGDASRQRTSASSRTRASTPATARSPTARSRS